MVKNLKNKIEVVDVRGIIVVCEESQWENHIAPFHPEVEDKIEEVENTIKDPDVIYQSAEDRKRDVYFRKMDNATDYMKVIVEMPFPNYGEIITAFPRKDISGNIDTEVIKYDKCKL